jgi:hypothetical protein
MVFKFSSDCGVECHESIRRSHLFESSDHYSIIDSTHALVYVPRSRADSLQKEFREIVTDFAVLVPELKIDWSLASVPTLCASSTLGSIDISVLLLPMDEEKLQNFLQFLFVNTQHLRWNEKDLASLRPSHENVLTLSVDCPSPSSSSSSAVSATSSLSSSSTAQNLITELSERAEVQWIERFFPMKPALRWASPVTQSGNVKKTPMHHANLTGAGHVIGIADTGIDGQSCFFVDPNVDVPFDTINHAHRKIVMYDTFADSVDADEHGTLVSGCAAGYCVDPKHNSFQYNGLAYEAKIAFVDIGKASSEYLVLPSNQYSGIYLPLYNAGARVMSMSWGSASNSYTTSARFVLPLVQILSSHPCSLSLSLSLSLSHTHTQVYRSVHVGLPRLSAPRCCRERWRPRLEHCWESSNMQEWNRCRRLFERRNKLESEWKGEHQRGQAHKEWSGDVFITWTNL